MSNNIMIVDHHPLFSEGLSSLLSRNGYIITSCHTTAERVHYSLYKEKPDFIIIDPALPDVDGFDIITSFMKSGMGIRVMVLSESCNGVLYNHCIKQGVSSYISKSAELVDILKAVKAVSIGELWYPKLQKSNTRNEICDFEDKFKKMFSKRELTVLQKLSTGMSNNDIAQELQLSNKTISTYKQRVLQKLNARTIIEALDIAKQFARY